MMDSLKTYGTAVIGSILTAVQWSCTLVEKLTVILIFLSVIVRLIYDLPKARDAINRERRKRRERRETKPRRGEDRK